MKIPKIRTSENILSTLVATDSSLDAIYSKKQVTLPTVNLLLCLRTFGWSPRYSGGISALWRLSLHPKEQSRVIESRKRVMMLNYLYETCGRDLSKKTTSEKVLINLKKQNYINY